MFPIIGLGEPYIPRFGGVLQECGYFTWSLADSVKNEGGLLGGCLTVKN